MLLAGNEQPCWELTSLRADRNLVRDRQSVYGGSDLDGQGK